MSSSCIKNIWNPETGITDLEVDRKKLGASEILGIKKVWAEQRERLQGSRQLSDFTERLSREWAIETGIIENLYDIERGVTQTLIERGFQAELLTHGSTNRPKDFVLNLLRDQKEALEGVFDFVSNKRTLSTSYIKELHAALLRSQDKTDGIDAQGRSVEISLIKGDWKTQPNFPERDGITYAYCPPEHVSSEMDHLVEIYLSHEAKQVPTEVQAAWLHHRFTQIHPFQDGNGRIARAITSLVLIKDGLFPLVVTRNDKPDYLEALEAADNGEIRPLINFISKLQRRQFLKAISMAETILSEDASVEAALKNLLASAENTASEKQESLEQAFDRAYDIRNDLFDHFAMIVPDVNNALLKVTTDGKASVSSSRAETEHFFRAQIIENAKDHLHYFANTSIYRSWISLNMVWTRRARLVFAFHGIGKPFSGSLICAPFLEFRDSDDDSQVQSTIVPLTEEGFVFFYNESKSVILERFAPWRNGVLKVALSELSQNL